MSLRGGLRLLPRPTVRATDACRTAGCQYSTANDTNRPSSTSALDHKLSHRHRQLPPLPRLERRGMEAGDAVSNILYNTPPPSTEPMKRHILNMFVQDEPGVLARVSGCLAARGVNIDSLVVCATDVRDLSRMCIVLRGQDGTIEQVRRQLEDLVPVWAVVDYTNTKVIEREIMLLRISILGPEYYEMDHLRIGESDAEVEVDYAVAHANQDDAPGGPMPAMSPSEALAKKSDNMRSIASLTEQFHGRVVDISDASVIVELCAKSARCDAFLKLVHPFGIIECSRSGTMVLPRTPIKSGWTGRDEAKGDEAVVMDASMLPPAAPASSGLPPTMTLAQFTPFVSQVGAPFWNTLSLLKLDEYQLDDDLTRVQADYSTSKTLFDRVSGAELGMGCRLRLNGDGIGKHITDRGNGADVRPMRHAAPMQGYLKNFNTLQEFKAADRQHYFDKVADEIWAASSRAATTGVASAAQPNAFLLLTFADLKSYRYYYWFAFPALLARAPGWMVAVTDARAPGWRPVDEAFSHDGLTALSARLSAMSDPVAFFVPSAERGDLCPLQDARAYLDTHAGTPLLLFVDPSPHAQSPGWPLRNILTSLATLHNVRRVRVICWKDSLGGELRSTWKSVVGELHLGDAAGSAATLPLDGRDTCVLARTRDVPGPDAVGWERNSQGKLAPKMVSLAAMLDPRLLADRAVDLNLKLMKWRVMPNLALDTIQSAEVLVIGAGTLGCYAAHSLLGWGIRRITFVDNGRVSFSNPVRQPLYEFSDCLDGGKPKAAAAADSLQRIFPGVHTEGYQLSVPMPGHPVPAAQQAATVEAIETLERLVSQHDVIFLMTDSRESRWFPTMLGAAHRKLVINAALGYDSYVVMRHGVHNARGPRLGCYFCSDVVAPADSLSDRTLDQMCTVTRPGLAAMAGACAVELMVSVLQHPDGAAALPDHGRVLGPRSGTPTRRHLHRAAPADDDEEDGIPSPTASMEHTIELKNDAVQQSDETLVAPASTPPSAHSSPHPFSPTPSDFGIVPHQVRGYLSRFSTMTLSSTAFDRCTACSSAVLDAYEQDGADVVFAACEDPEFLERISALDELKRETDALDLDMEWQD
ncbi:Autophagy protein 7 [Malassezia sp. CBS 17886]|nr:Autophagy protein 7 [Malassezia sp. CBS 17886]